MSNPVQQEVIAPHAERGLFYKCPVGGFVSLRPGSCPKCLELLTPVIVRVDADVHSGNSSGVEHMRRANACLPDEANFLRGTL
jgi:hypothetical protein